MAVKSLKETRAEDFAKAIMTTDTHHKLIKETIKGKKEYTIVGIAKGSGMINPLFATMLAFVFTDYPVSPNTIKATFRQAAHESFEKITVDGECSTNDTIALFTKKGPEDVKSLDAFKEKLSSVMKDLAMMVVRDGEGATKIAHIIVNGTEKKRSPKR